MSTETPAVEASPIEPIEVEGAKPDEPLGESGITALKSEREARKAAEKAAADAQARIKEFEDRDKTELQKLIEENESLRAENTGLKSANMRAEVAAAKGIPASLLTGSTQDELEASADALIAFKGAQEPQKLIVPNEGKSTDLPLNGDGLEQSLKKALGIS